MTPETPVPAANPVLKQKRRRKVDPESDSKLALLLTMYARAKEESNAASELADEYQSQIKKAILEAAGDDVPDSFDIAADPMGGYPAFTFSYTEPSWVLDSKRMKAEAPETYVEYAKQTRGFWTFKQKTNYKGKK